MANIPHEVALPQHQTPLMSDGEERSCVGNEGLVDPALAVLMLPDVVPEADRPLLNAILCPRKETGGAVDGCG